MSPPDWHIALPPRPCFPERPRASDPASPASSFYTPPSSPLTSPNIYYTPPTSPMQADPPLHGTDDPFPIVMDVALDLALDDEGLTTLEKIYLYSRSKAAFHRVFIAHALPAYLTHVTPQEAVEYVLPLLSGLAMDDDESVKEALAAELVPVIWWFFSHCQIIPDDLMPEEAYASSSTTVTISVQAFTPILGTLLLNSNPLVGGVARFAVVDLLSRINKADKREIDPFYHRGPDTPHVFQPWEITYSDHENDNDFEDDDSLVIGLFGTQERAMFMQEVLQQIVIGMGRLDVGVEGTVDEQPNAPDTDRINPYFSSVSANFPPTSSSTFHPWSSSPPSRSTEPASLRSRNMGPGPNLSPGTEFPPSLSSTSPPRSPNGLDSTIDVNWHDMYARESLSVEDEQAAVGRLSSMSLMAAVTASVSLQDDMQRTFVKEVERIACDPIYWVRREASFAVGALAKVVPEDVINISLLPIFVSLRWDRVWHVRHSTLFALPSILSRLAPMERRTLAVETIHALFEDENPTVRSGVLEALGEVLHTFLGDPDGPPNELLHLFLGRKEDHRVRDGRQEELSLQNHKKTIETPLESFFTDPKRPLICAFNFPAVALTLGGERWCEIREVYLQIASNPACGIRRTLAASLGEIAKIIGPEQAQTDLTDVWWTSIKSDDEEVRMKAVECLRDLVGVVGKVVGKTLMQGLLTAWNQGALRSWRERELIGKELFGWVNLLGPEDASIARAFLAKGLEDNAAAVRDMAISTIPQLYAFYSSQKDVIYDFRDDLQKLATSPVYRKRMTFIACQQTLALSAKDNDPLVALDNDFFRSVTDLADDDIEGVRIGVARFVGLVYGNLLRHSHSIPSELLDLIHRLSQDPCQGVQSYMQLSADHDASLANSRDSRKRRLRISIFSRPPPPQDQSEDSLTVTPLGSLSLRTTEPG